MTTLAVPESLLARLLGAQRLLITSHVHPDGDSLGSSLGLAEVLHHSGRDATIWHRDPAPSIYRPLEELARTTVHRGATPPPGFPTAFDLVVVLECPTLDRCGLEDWIGMLPLVNLDHHLGNSLYGVENWVVPEAPAVASLVVALAEHAQWTIDSIAAHCLYLALHTDTGGFRFDNTGTLAFETAAILTRQGARPAVIATWLNERQPAATVRLLGEMLRSLELHEDGSVASAELRREMFQRAAARDEDAEGLIDTPRSIAGVEVVLVLREEPDGAVKGSLRSRGAVDVEAIARRLGGGGHRAAAGFRRTGETLAESKRIALAEVGGALVSRADVENAE